MSAQCAAVQKAYRHGAFDFLAAYVVPEKAWYILPAREIAGMRSVSLCTPTSAYEKYREAWELLREAVGVSAEVDDEAREAEGPQPYKFPLNAFERMQEVERYVRKFWGM
jgi:hypothetical protein